MKKYLIVLLIFAMMLNCFVNVFAVEFANSSTQGIPDGIEYLNKNNYRLNMTLLKDKHIIVYGDASAVPANRFKRGSIPIGDVNNDNLTMKPFDKSTGIGCYYSAGGNLGEYEFHGYDFEGNVYSNENFPVDEIMTKPVDSYRWIYRIWDDKSPFNNYSKIQGIGEYNKIAIGSINYDPLDINNMRHNIEKSLGWVIKNPIGIFGNEDTTSAYNYAHVYSLPTRYTNGQVLMHHYNGNKVWYANFTTPNLGLEKKILRPKANFENKVEGEVCTVDLRGKIDDELYYKDDIKRSLYYTRQDIKSWDFEFKDQTGKTSYVRDVRNNSINSDKAKFSFPFETSDNQKKIYGRVTVNYAKGKEIISSTSDWIELPLDVMPPLPPLEIHDAEVNTYPVTPEIQAPKYMLDTEKFKLKEYTDYTNVVGNADVYLDGRKLSHLESREFLSGQYLFPLLGRDKIYSYTIRYKNQLNIESEFTSYVLVYTTKPSTQINVVGKHKENRKLIALNDSSAINSSYLLNRSSMEVIKFDIYGEKLCIASKDNNSIEFLSKLPENDININLMIKCNVEPQFVERYDIPQGYHISNDYIYTMQVIPDYKPAVIANIWNFVLTRNESINITYEQVSTDGDTISSENSRYDLYYDRNRDGYAEELIESGRADMFGGYKPSNLGTYRVVFYVDEMFGEQTIDKFITQDDKKFTIVEQQFYVENLAPNTQLYIDVPENYPQVDVMVLNDGKINRERNNDIISTRISLMNDLIRNNLDPSVQVWDMHTYTYTQDASTVLNTGGTYPPTSTEHSVNGYTGTLNRYNVVNNPYQYDAGNYVSKKVSATRPNTEVAYYNSKGVLIGASNPQLPSSITVDGATCYKVSSWKGSTSETYSTDEKGNKYVSSVTIAWVALYEGTKTEWVSNWIWRDSYTGYYSGKIYKNVKQQFNPVYRDSSNKYIVYFADSDFCNMADYNYISSRAKSKVIIVGNQNLLKDERIKADLFIDNSKSLEQIYVEIVKFISEDNVKERGATVLVNEKFTVSFADKDIDGDTIISEGFQIVHEPEYFDNSMGKQQNTADAFDKNGYVLKELPDIFEKTGKFEIYRKIKDMPMDFVDKSELSNDAKITLLVHRKPIAKCTLNWTFDNLEKVYKTIWEDKSYDPDLEKTDPENKKGIRERKIKYRKLDSTEWIFEIPDNLQPAKYELEYIVKDNFGVWSEPFKMNFELPKVPPAQIRAKLKTEKSEFSLLGVPASENLIAYDVWTRYPFDVKLEVSMLDGENTVSPIKTIDFSEKTGIKNNQDISWKDIIFNIPATLKNKEYTLRIKALDVKNPTISSNVDFSVNVITPIDLKPSMPTKITALKKTDIDAFTSKYVNSSYKGSGVYVTLFSGTSYEKTIDLNKTNGKWNGIYNDLGGIPEGKYIASFKAILPSGEFEVKEVQYEYLYNTPPVIEADSIGTESNMGYIYENDDVKYLLKLNDADLNKLDVNIKLYRKNNLDVPIKEHKITAISDSGKYSELKINLIDDILIGDYILKTEVTDEYGEKAYSQIDFTAHDLWVKGGCKHTEKWEKNRISFNSIYPAKSRSENKFWCGEALETLANTTIIDARSNVECTKVVVEISKNLDSEGNKYPKVMIPQNNKRDLWNLKYWDEEWIKHNGKKIIKWGLTREEKLNLRFTAYFNNGWKETDIIEIYMDNTDDYWKLHRIW